MTLTIMARSTLCERLPWLAIGLLLAAVNGCSSGCNKEDDSAVGEAASKASSAALTPSPVTGAAKLLERRSPQPARDAAASRGKGAGAFEEPTRGPDDYDPVSITTDADPESGGAPLTVTFSAAVEGGPPGLRYRWEFGDDTPPVRQLRAEHTYQQAGDYTATFWVNGPPELEMDESSEINIEVTEEAFDFDIETDPDFGTAPLKVEFVARLEDEDLPGPFYYQWDFGDGARDVSNPTTHLYRTPGEYTATATVSNAQGQQATREVEITVDAPDEKPEEDQ